jgi:hypothetical protein
MTDLWFKALGLMAFYFAALEDLIGLCIIEWSDIDPDKEKAIWDKRFKEKVNVLSRAFDDVPGLADYMKTEIPELPPMSRIRERAQELGHRRNNFIHGTLAVNPETREVALGNRSFKTFEKIDAEVAEEIIAELRSLTKDLTGYRGRVRFYKLFVLGKTPPSQ